jgi:hypothetical protein
MPVGPILSLVVADDRGTIAERGIRSPVVDRGELFAVVAALERGGDQYAELVVGEGLAVDAGDFRRDLVQVPDLGVRRRSLMDALAADHPDEARPVKGAGRGDIHRRPDTRRSAALTSEVL